MELERTPLVAGNWKMFKTRAETAAFCAAFAPLIAAIEDVDIALCPPFTSLDVVGASLGQIGIGVWGQTMHAAADGAFTGEISSSMLIDAGATGVLLGHSERRALFGETDAELAGKVKAALAAGLEPVLCIGESEAERERGDTETRLRTQLEGALTGLDGSRALQLTVAYEPVWAIGTGMSATPELAQEAHAFIRSVLAELFGDDAALAIRLLYGGSVKPENAAELMGQADIDGALVGGASLDPQSLAGIVRAAA